MSIEQNTTLHVTGMTCNSCAATVGKFLERQGMNNVSVSFATGEVFFVNQSGKDINFLVRGIDALGYKVVDEQRLKSAGKLNLSKTEWSLIISLMFTIPLLSHMFLPVTILHNGFFQLGLCIPVLIIGLLNFWKSAIGSIKNRIPNMDVLILTGSLAAFVHSVISLFLFSDHHPVLFFETSAAIISFVLFGNAIEQRSVRATNSSLDLLNNLQPVVAKLISGYNSGNETIRDISVSSLLKGDYILINEGEQITVDGVIVWGNCIVDESMLTGESLPLEKVPGSAVFAGTLLQSGTIKVKTEKTSDKTLLSGIIDLVKKSQHDKPPVQRLGDKASAVFVPVVLIIALVTFLLSYFVFDVVFAQSLLHSVAVLVVACPCAMGLATPTAIAVAVGRAAKSGVLIRSATALESLSGIKTMVFDKTGTLTTGNFSVKHIQVLNNSVESDVISIIKSISKHSNHPISVSLNHLYRNENVREINFKEINEIKGKGVEAIDADGNVYKLGSASFVNESSDNSLNNLFINANNKILAKIELGDEIRKEAVQVIKHFNSNQIQTVMLSGDSQQKCEAVQKQLYIEKVFAEQLPSQKHDKIIELKKNGSVAIIGDGINDAPSLAIADVGISLSDASQIAINSASIILLNNNDLSKLKWIHLFAQKTLTVIKQNLFWAIFYNALTIPLAAAGYISPLYAALSMAFSDVIVIGNSLRLKYVKIAV